MSRFILICLVLAVWIVDGAAAQAVDYFWTNPLGGAFDEPSHWTPFAPPATQGPGGASDTVNFDLGVASSNRYVVSDAGRENSQLIVHNDSVELTIFVNQTFSSSGGADPSVVVGAASGDVGDLVLSAGGASVLETDVTRVANAAGSEGSVEVRGLDWSGGNFRVGYAGDGTLFLDTDASINSTNVSIAHLTGSIGHAAVRGPWDISGNFIVGREGEGSLEITNAGNISSNSSSIGDQSTGIGVVTVGRRWTTANALTVGNSGSGTLRLAGTPANVTSTDAFVGRLAGSTGEVVVTAGDWTVNGRLSIAGDADAATIGGDGTVEITGGTVTVAEDITLFPNGDILFDGGSLDVPTITVQSGGVFDWTGGELFVDTFDGNLSNNGGTLAARDGSNSMLVSGEYAQGPDGVLSIEIAGSAASGQFDKLMVGNSAFLDGTLDVDLAEPFQPSAGETYTIVDALNFGAGSFSNVANGERLFVIGSRGSFLVNYGLGSPFDPSQVVLTDFQPAATGDFDGDGDADGSDFLIWQQGGSHNSLSATDLEAWKAHFGPPPASVAAAAVPEPGGMGMVAAALSVVTFPSRRRGSSL